MQSSPDKRHFLREQKHRDLSKIAITELVIASRSANGREAEELKALAGRINLCNHQDNIWCVANGYSNADGSTSPAIGRYWRCNSKLCSSCLARQSQLSRAKLRLAIKRQQPQKHHRYYFITFTIPNPNLTLRQTRYLVNRAWSLFRKRSLCVSLIRGGIKSEEFTVTNNGFHYHLHLIVLSNFISYARLREDWSYCVEKAFAEEHIPFETNMADGRTWINVKPIIPTERSIQEVCKYVTKADSWRKVKRSDLVELAQVRRWHRMFELFGSFAEREAIAEGDVQPIVHTRSLSDESEAKSPRYWRDKLAYMDAEFYLTLLEAKVDSIIHFESLRIYNLFGQKPVLNWQQISELVSV